MRLQEIKLIKKKTRAGSIKGAYPDGPYFKIRDGVVYMNKDAVRLLDIRKFEGVRMGTGPGHKLFAYRSEEGSANTFSVIPKACGGSSFQSVGVSEAGIEGYFTVSQSDPTEDGTDLFELSKV
jgi:hypothetical protein